MDSSFNISKDMDEDIPVILFEGDLTSEADSEFIEIYKSIKDKIINGRLIINFEKTSYINSAGLATLINIIQDIGEEESNVVFVGLSNHFLKVMDIVGITDFVKTLDTQKEARELLK